MPNRYKVPCITEGTDVFAHADSKPTVCPNDSEHTIDADGIVLVSFGQRRTLLVDEDDVPLVSASGGLRTSRTYSSFEDDEGFAGVLVKAAANSTTIVDYEITTQINAAGGSFWTSGGQIDDYIDVSVVDKNDILGLFGTYGLTVGVDVLELGKWVDKLYINPNGIPWAELIADDVAPVVSGLFLRSKYENTGNASAVVSITYKVFHVGV